MQIQPISGYFWAIFGLYQPPAPPPFFFGSRPPLFTYPGSSPADISRHTEMFTHQLFHIRSQVWRVDTNNIKGLQWLQQEEEYLTAKYEVNLELRWGKLNQFGSFNQYVYKALMLYHSEIIISTHFTFQDCVLMTQINIVHQHWKY